METLRLIVVLVHLIGFAVLFGSWAAQAFGGERKITKIMDYGLAIAGLAGLALAAPWGIDYDLNYVKIGTKLVILLVIGAMLGIGMARQKRGRPCRRQCSGSSASWRSRTPLSRCSGAERPQRTRGAPVLSRTMSSVPTSGVCTRSSPSSSARRASTASAPTRSGCC